MSADFEDDCVIVVWDTETGVPVSTLFSPHGNQEMTVAKISPNAKYIVTVGNELHQKVQLWLWTYGKEKPNATVEITEFLSDRIKKIAFNDDISEEFILTADYNVAFFKWEEDELKYHIPKILGNIRRYGIFTCSCYISRTQRVLTATTNGYVLVWDVPAKKGYKPNKTNSQDAINNKEKRHIKSVQLTKSNIMVVLHHDRMILTGTAEGRISFYDCNLKILYWCKHELLDSIRSISFDLESALLGPVATVSESEIDTDEEDDLEYEGEIEEYPETKLEDTCVEKMKYIEKIESMKYCSEVSLMTTIHLEKTIKDYGKKQKSFKEKLHVPTDATIENAPFYVKNFIVMTGNVQGFICLYDYEKRRPILRRKTPALPDFSVLVEEQVKCGNIVYITCPQSHEKLVAVTIIKYSPMADLLVCGLENGILWMLHPITLEPIDPNPYKHSTESILQLAFTECEEYMAYADNTLVVAVFSKNHDNSSGSHLWNFIGKYRSHYATIREILFGPATTESVVYRLFSMGEDRNLIEYDLKNSGPYPFPGLKIIGTYKIECDAIPLCLTWYPQLGVEGFLMYSNSEYKYRLLNDITKTIRGTFLGPLYGAPVKHMKVLSGKEYKGGKYMIFATNKEIGIQMLPFDGNPYKSLGMIGHPRKITDICISYDGNLLFTSGYNDSCILIWKIKSRSVEVLAHLGGRGIAPYYCLLEGGRNGWLINEMKDMFYYAQILHQGENMTGPRVLSETVSTKEIPNLMRAVGYYPSNEEIEILMGEISYKNYAETGYLVEEIKFEDFVKLYLNHRPAFGISLQEIKDAFRFFTNPDQIPVLDVENPALSRDQFMRILFGEGPHTFLMQDGIPFG
ncbi:PREDICTED: WD repeat-containing protein 66-like [Eufriesea mexicana]|uniref:WD repeat-containing protein 66-like n=1 Tax=Eufriesea mexicana TaxID=516756 RepID=UPI00083BC8B9|nr:PREDICTED: WD repeat-containing protein 66-like [Eufriesea mexicana]